MFRDARGVIVQTDHLTRTPKYLGELVVTIGMLIRAFAPVLVLRTFQLLMEVVSWSEKRRS